METKNLPPLEVLIVEDELSIRSLLRRVIKDTDVGATANITEAADGQDGIDNYFGRIQSGLGYFHLVISDIRMPGINGVGLLKRIKESGHPSMVYMISAYADSKLIQEMRELAPDGFFTKPFKISDIEEALNTADLYRKAFRQPKDTSQS